MIRFKKGDWVRYYDITAYPAHRGVIIKDSTARNGMDITIRNPTPNDRCPSLWYSAPNNLILDHYMTFMDKYIND